jgi:hypothetical protein
MLRQVRGGPAGYRRGAPAGVRPAAGAVKVTEHQLIERECGCGHRTRAAAPAGADGPVQYGPWIAAIVI